MLVVIHEMAHSWFGNTITCSTWEHLWLNEGLTTFMEYKGQKEFFGEDVYNIMGSSSEASLKRTVESLMEIDELNSRTKLNPPASKYNPDDLSDSIPYDKGH